MPGASVDASAGFEAEKDAADTAVAASGTVVVAEGAVAVAVVDFADKMGGRGGSSDVSDVDEDG